MLTKSRFTRSGSGPIQVEALLSMLLKQEEDPLHLLMNTQMILKVLLLQL